MPPAVSTDIHLSKENIFFVLENVFDFNRRRNENLNKNDLL